MSDVRQLKSHQHFKSNLSINVKLFLFFVIRLLEGSVVVKKSVRDLKLCAKYIFMYLIRIYMVHIKLDYFDLQNRN